MTVHTGLEFMLLCSFSWACLACTGSQPPAEAPTSNGPAQGQTELLPSEPMSGRQSLEVGMQFNDNHNDEERPKSHDAPPTASWKPVEKDKTTDLKKMAVTASRESTLLPP